jgi:integrase
MPNRHRRTLPNDGRKIPPPTNCRHTAASLLYAQGVPELQIAAILGHTDPAFTRRTYTHLFPEMRRAAAESIEVAVGRAL